MADSKQDIVLCDCSGTTNKKIESLIEQGIDDLEGISRKTGAIAGCGGCEWDIDEFIQAYKAKEKS
jgi:bacterioferritin-associated ferredoxin